MTRGQKIWSIGGPIIALYLMVLFLETCPSRPRPPAFANMDEWALVDEGWREKAERVSRMNYTPVKPRAREDAIDFLTTNTHIRLDNVDALALGGRLIDEGEICYLVRGISALDDPGCIFVQRHGQTLYVVYLCHGNGNQTMIKWPVVYYTQDPITQSIATY